MYQNFEYTEKLDSITITKYIGEDSKVVVPETIHGKKVNRIDNYAFHECRHITEVNLPKTVKSIGSHSFYNCRKLKRFQGTDVITSIEDGAFKNCDALDELIFEVKQGKFQCVKNILSDISLEVDVTLIYGEQEHLEIAKLIFPRYLQDYVENTEARIINQITYGAGIHYRECINESDVDYKRYDDLFAYATANDKIETAYRIAIARLTFPYKLSNNAKSAYFQFISLQLSEIVKGIMKNNDFDTLTKFSDLKLFTKENIDTIIDMAYENHYVEGTRFLMQYKKTEYGSLEKKFDF